MTLYAPDFHIALTALGLSTYAQNSFPSAHGTKKYGLPVPISVRPRRFWVIGRLPVFWTASRN